LAQNAGDAAERGEPHELDPQLLGDLGRKGRIDAGVLAGGGEALAARAPDAVSLAEDERATFPTETLPARRRYRPRRR
jgi:hypothetical protein